MITYNGLIWERKAHYGDPGIYFEEKTLYSVEESLERVKKAGYERHPRPYEVFT